MYSEAWYVISVVQHVSSHPCVIVLWLMALLYNYKLESC